ncbi:hypothetical protein [Lacinutrix chionoecetis]
MKKLFYLFIICAVAFVSCDGRDRTQKTNAEVLADSKLLDSFSQKTRYIPEKHTKKVTDTILDNGFNLKIKEYTTTDKEIELVENNDGITLTRRYRIINTELTISFKDQVILENKSISNLIKNTDALSDTTIENSLIYLNYDEIQPINTEELKLSIILFNPKLQIAQIYKLLVNSNGEYDIESGDKLNTYIE